VRYNGACREAGEDDAEGRARVFFVTYLRRELSGRARRAVLIALGLAVGVGLVITVSAASAGTARAESGVLGALYGAGTNVAVTGGAVSPRPGAKVAPGQTVVAPPPGGHAVTDVTSTYLGISASKVAEAARLPGVTAAAGGIMLLYQDTDEASGGYTVYGVDTRDGSLGPLGSASLVLGHSFTAAESDADVAVLDSGYAKSNGLRVGSPVSIDQVKYTVIGIVSQPQGSNPPDVYVPLARAQAMPLLDGNLHHDVNTIYLTAASAAGISAVSKEITALLPGTSVTTASNLAGQATGSLVSAIRLVDDLGRWLSVLVLAAAFAMAGLLTLAAVSSRVREFGTLKAIGWRSRRIVAQVLGESAAVGVAGAAAGAGLGFAGAAIIAAVAPKVYATFGDNSQTQDGPVPHSFQVGGGNLIHTVPVPLNPTVSAGVIVLAVLLALAGALLAGAFASSRIAVLRPADALARVA
jgi:putative ABC transport system permease protein